MLASQQTNDERSESRADTPQLAAGSFIQYIEETAYEDYDKLIQLCDAISLPFTLVKWKAFMELKKYFDGKCGCNIYSFLPNVMENSFDSLIYTA
ncbi:hypothetical protein [uncultured Acetatifactor sp.]|uniref:hypothetical protein n=1 Tax=uncultured Acetatifactor sp. TaxID=1671927 RepID=UPI0026335483|nr:hypothetical protein [uncultured Acetatifactor sp.]